MRAGGFPPYGRPILFTGFSQQGLTPSPISTLNHTTEASLYRALTPEEIAEIRSTRVIQATRSQETLTSAV